MNVGDTAKINKSFKCFSSGTLVRVDVLGEEFSTVKLLSTPEDLYLKNLKAHGIQEDGVFEIPTAFLTARRYRLG